MESNIAIVLYLLSFRLAVILSGVAAIYLGYKLFVLGVYGRHSQKNDEISASLGEVQFKLVNVAPGTTFALFGATLIVTMLLKSPPQVTSHSNGTDFRGVPTSASADHESDSCWLSESEKVNVNDIESCWQGLATALNDQAWYLYEQQANPRLPIKLVSLAIAASPDDKFITEFEDTLNQLENIESNKKN